MRKLTGLFIAAAVAGTVWWQLPQRTGRPLSAQTGRSASGQSNPLGSIFSRGSQGYTAQEAYRLNATSLMRQAQEQYRRGNTSEAKRLALQASRYSVDWQPN